MGFYHPSGHKLPTSSHQLHLAWVGLRKSQQPSTIRIQRLLKFSNPLGTGGFIIPTYKIALKKKKTLQVQNKHLLNTSRCVQNLQYCVCLCWEMSTRLCWIQNSTIGTRAQEYSQYHVVGAKLRLATECGPVCWLPLREVAAIKGIGAKA